ncbi:helix-turn-helix domain-containing protein [Micromonospora citrea]|uniref:helix-turn-helix domain-containing protein n=1 Tax=Micromonospora citrea TaxID=47855 RepID=UPI002480B8DF|nr:helix-turn-helix transcriptional regulator [Micromonospora citrea]
MPPRARTVVDPRFAAELRRLRKAGGMSLRQLASLVNHGKSLIHQLETGQTKPTVGVAARLDEALAAQGALARLVADAPDGGDAWHTRRRTNAGPTPLRRERRPACSPVTGG